jgi:SAM-dependent methyltransferase
MMRTRGSTAAIILLAVVLGAGCDSWRGFGFRASGPEMLRLRHELALKPGMSVADVGAGRGELTVALAAEVGPSGQVFSTDMDIHALEQIRALVAAAALQNVTLVQAHVRDTGLPTHCCDTVVLRRVYHHLSDPLATNGDLLRALRPGGVLAVIDFPPILSWLWPWPPKGVPRNRTATAWRPASWSTKSRPAASSSSTLSITGRVGDPSRAIVQSSANPERPMRAGRMTRRRIQPACIVSSGVSRLIAVSSRRLVAERRHART